MKKKNNYTKTHNLYKIIFLFVVFLGIGYAFLEANLNINGDVTVTAPDLNVYISSVTHYDEYSYGITGTSSLVGADKREYDVTATIPVAHDIMDMMENYEDYGYYDRLTIVNKGSKDAYIDNVDLKVYDSTGNLINIDRSVEENGELGISFLYVGSSSSVSHEKKIAAGESVEVGVNIVPILDGNFAGNEVTYTYKLTIDAGVDLFSKDSWSTIISNVQNGTIPDYYRVGSTKPVTLNIDLDNDGTPEEHTYDLRIANISTPAECSTQGYSQTACGFVLEFVQSVTTHAVNSSTTGSGNGIGSKGSWEYSEIRSYVNGDIYNALPSELKNAIAETSVVTGHGTVDTANFTTQDHLYLPSPKEVWNADTSVDTAANNTRQLDYYASKGVGMAITQKENSLGVVPIKSPEQIWWTRTPHATKYNSFSSSFGGALNYAFANNNYGVAPAFRIGTNN